MSKRVLVPIADGSEEIETTCITDTLTRFGADVTTASVMPDGQLICKMSRGIKVRTVLRVIVVARTHSLNAYEPVPERLRKVMTVSEVVNTISSLAHLT